VLQIRVTAQTWDEREVLRAWPNLCALAWPEPRVGADAPGPPHGVLDLVRTLDDERRFGDWKEDVARELGPRIDAAVALAGDLEKALADWQPSQANRLSEELEQALDDMNGLAPEAKDTIWSKFGFKKRR
jgi:hypothetical protein